MPHGYLNAEVFRLIASDNTRLQLTFPIQALEVTGLAFPPIEKRTVRSPFQHGETYLGFSLGPRTVQFTLHLRGNSRAGLWGRRQQLVQVLNPLLGPFKVQVGFADGSIRELHQVVYSGGFELGVSTAPDPTSNRIAFELVAYDPVWFGREEAANFATTIAHELVFPAHVPLTFDTAGAINQVLSLTVHGTWFAYPTIVCTGPLSYPTITNLSTGAKIRLLYVVPNGDAVTIRTAFGERGVTNSAGVSLDGYLSNDSDLVGFYLLPEDFNNGNPNQVSVSAGNCGVASGVSVQWSDRYIAL